MITTQYPHTGYAVLAALLGAGIAEDIGDTATARVRLQWLVDNVRDPATRDLARVRLAAVLLDEKNYPDALTLLETQHAAIWDALYSNLRGDVLMAQGRRAEARAAYQIAIDKSITKNPFRALVQAKLDTLDDGDTK
jgi:predicted negative regulator of RcsB-dependent stress response